MSNLGLAQIYANSPVEKVKRVKLEAVISSYVDKRSFCESIGFHLDDCSNGQKLGSRTRNIINKIMGGEMPLESYQWEMIEKRFRELDPHVQEYWLKFYGLKII